MQNFGCSRALVGGATGRGHPQDSEGERKKAGPPEAPVSPAAEEVCLRKHGKHEGNGPQPHLKCYRMPIDSIIYLSPMLVK